MTVQQDITISAFSSDFFRPIPSHIGTEIHRSEVTDAGTETEWNGPFQQKTKPPNVTQVFRRANRVAIRARSIAMMWLMLTERRKSVVLGQCQTSRPKSLGILTLRQS